MFVTWALPPIYALSYTPREWIGRDEIGTFWMRIDLGVVGQSLRSIDGAFRCPRTVAS
jgi:hypothetical protein